MPLLSLLVLMPLGRKKIVGGEMGSLEVLASLHMYVDATIVEKKALCLKMYLEANTNWIIQ